MNLSGRWIHRIPKSSAASNHTALPGGHGGRKENTMTNQEAYLSDLNDLRKEIDYLLSLVPVGNSKKALQAKEQAEEVAGRARATIDCMKNDYIIVDC